MTDTPLPVIHPDWHWTAADLVSATGGRWLSPPAAATPFRFISTDTRQLQPGGLFLALQGERFDAHDFVQQAAQAGAAGLIVSRAVTSPLPQLLVDDTRLALGRLGHYRRQQMTGLQVIALTGSSGKTTTKELLGSILRQCGDTLVTRGNLNNDLGVPLMLLELTRQQRYAVLELGANHVGEIGYTTALVQPDAAAVLNIGTAHVGEFGGRDGIARAKSEIFSGLSAQGTAVIPAQDDFVSTLQAAAGDHHLLRFGEQGDIWASEIELQAEHSQFTLNTPQGAQSVRLHLAGRHNIDNALAAAALALAIGISLKQIVSGISSLRSVSGRLAFHRQGQRLVIDDTYNANPHAMRAAAAVLLEQPVLPEHRLMIVGDMAELGDQTTQEHAALGQSLRQLPLTLWAVGEFASVMVPDPLPSAQDSHQAFASKADAEAALRSWLTRYVDQPVVVLLKGSRSAAMETFLVPLLEKP